MENPELYFTRFFSVPLKRHQTFAPSFFFKCRITNCYMELPVKKHCCPLTQHYLDNHVIFVAVTYRGKMSPHNASGIRELITDKDIFEIRQFMKFPACLNHLRNRDSPCKIEIPYFVINWKHQRVKYCAGCLQDITLLPLSHCFTCVVFIITQDHICTYLSSEIMPEYAKPRNYLE